MKKGWKIKKLGDLCTIQLGKTPHRKTERFWDKDKNSSNVWLSIADMVHGKELFDSKEYVSDLGTENINITPKGTLIISFKLTIGRVSFAGYDLFTNEAIASLIDLSSDILKQYLFYYFTFFDWDKATEGDIKVKGKTLNKEKLKALSIIVPPLPEQQQIVAILDKAFTSIATAKENAQQNLLNAKELFESYLQNVFENKGDVWEKKRLDEVCKITSKLIDPKESQYKDLIHIGAGNIVSEKGTLIDLKTAKEENLISGKFLFDESMVLYSKIRPYLKKIVKCEFKGLCSADIYPLVPYKDKMIQSFLYHLLSSNHFTEYAIEGSQRAGMPKVNRKHLFEYSFSLPPIKEQQQIVKKLNSLSAETKKLEGIYQQKINDLEELKKSVLEKAFKGELKMVN